MTKRKFKTLFLDIECAPNVGFFWQSGYKLRIPPENIIKERAIICICYKWAGQKTVHEVHWDDDQCDRRLLWDISKVISKADEVIGHNGDAFDLKWIHGRLAFHNLDPLPDFLTTDTLKLARKKFRLNSNKLDYLGEFFGLGRKIQTGGFKLWEDICLKKCPKAMRKMIQYCKQDVILLEKVYDKISLYVPNIHKGRIMGNGVASCHRCGSLKIRSNGRFVTKAGLVRRRFRCDICGAGFNVKM